MKRAAGLVTPLVAVVLLAGCTSSSGATPTPTTPTSASSVSVAPVTATPSASAPASGTTGTVTAPSEIPATHWAAVLADLQARGVATADVQVVSAKAVTWPNGALGCPKPGMAYTQALVDGYQVVVTVGGTRYDYRFGRTATPRLCEL